MAVDDSYTKSLLHMDGADASTTFTDESGKAWTAAGNAQIDTAQSKFGGASGLFDGTGDYVSTPDHADFDVGSGEFTVDLWFKQGAINVSRSLFAQANSTPTVASTSVFCYIQSTNRLYAYVASGASAYIINPAATVTDTTIFHHLVLTRTVNTLKLALDGTFYADTQNLTGVTVNNSASTFRIGCYGEYTAGFGWNGWIDEFRFSKGIARWTANFTPPVSPYAPPSAGGIGISPYMIF